MSHPSPFDTPEGEARFRAAYDAALKLWPVPYEELDIPTRFGATHVVAAGAKNAPALVLLHGYMATSVMWWPNVADFAKSYRVYAVDIMGQPSKSIPGEPVRSAADYVAWLTETFDALHLDRACLVGMSVRRMARALVRARRTGARFEAGAVVSRRTVATGSTVHPARDADDVRPDTSDGELVHALGGIHGRTWQGGCDARTRVDVSRAEAFSDAARNAACRGERGECIVRRRSARLARSRCCCSSATAKCCTTRQWHWPARVG